MITDVFDIQRLPNDELGHLLQFLTLKDKKNLRKCCKILAEKLMVLAPDLRKWQIYVGKKNWSPHRGWEERGIKDFKHLEKAKEKGITSLPNVKIHFHLSRIYDGQEFKAAVVWLSAWQTHIIGLDVEYSGELSIQQQELPVLTQLLPLQLPQLEKLHLKLMMSDTDSKLAAIDIVTKHSGKLKELTLPSGMDLTNQDNFGPPVPKLESLKLKHVTVRFFQPILHFGRNVTKLELSYCQIMPENLTSIDPDSLKLPNLRELVTKDESAGSYLLIKSNSGWLETLGLHFFSASINATLSLPRIKTLVLECIYVDILTLLDICKTSLETLICLDGNICSGIRLHKLANLIAPVSPFTIDMIKLNAPTLQFVSLEVYNFEWSYEELTNLPEGKFPLLKQIIICAATPGHSSGLQKKYPSADILYEKTGCRKLTSEYLMKSQGLHIECLQ